MPRVRVRETFNPSGGNAYRRLNGTDIVDIVQGSTLATRDRCEDDLGPTKDHPLYISHLNTTYKTINGQDGNPAGPNFRYYREYFPVSLSPSSHLPLPSRPSASAAATTLLARTNPGRAEVSIPVFIAELKDLPHMVKSAGDYLLKRRKNWFRSTAGQYLSWQFGWSPLFSDLRKMLDFESSVTKRAKEIERLYSNKGLKRRVRLGNWGAAETHNSQAIESGLGTVLSARMSIFTQSERWGTVRWLPTDRPTSILDLPDYRKLARKAVFGLSFQAEDAWNLIPWSWLVDWFSNAGEYLTAHNNRVPAKPTSINVMTRTSTSRVWTPTSSNWIKWKPSSADFVTLERYVGGGSLNATLDFLSPRQMSILGALAVTRAKGSARYSR